MRVVHGLEGPCGFLPTFFSSALPRGWPFIRFAGAPNHGGHWKLGGIDAFAGPDRPLAWIDDHQTPPVTPGRRPVRARRCWSRPSRTSASRRRKPRVPAPGLPHCGHEGLPPAGPRRPDPPARRLRRVRRGHARGPPSTYHARRRVSRGVGETARGPARRASATVDGGEKARRPQLQAHQGSELDSASRGSCPTADLAHREGSAKSDGADRHLRTRSAYRGRTSSRSTTPVAPDRTSRSLVGCAQPARQALRRRDPASPAGAPGPVEPDAGGTPASTASRSSASVGGLQARRAEVLQPGIGARGARSRRRTGFAPSGVAPQGSRPCSTYARFGIPALMCTPPLSESSSSRTRSYRPAV